MDRSLPGSSVHGIFQARVLEWGAIAFSKILPAAAAKSLQSCPTLCDPIDGSPPGSPVPGILQARTLEWVAISLSNTMEYYSAIKKEQTESVPVSWLNLEPIIQSEVEKQILYINTYIQNLEKMVLKNLFTGQQWRNRYRE